MQQNPFDQFDAQPSPFGNRPVIHTPPPEPKEPKTSYRTLTPDEIRARGFNPKHAYQISSEGKVDDLGEVATDETNPKQQISGDLNADHVIRQIGVARGQIDSGYDTGNFFGSKGFQSLPIVGQNSANLGATLSGLQGSVINDTIQQLKQLSATGASGYGALSETEAERLAGSVAALQQTQDAASLKRNLQELEQHYRAARAILAGEDPRDPKVASKYGIGAAANQQNAPGGPPPPSMGGGTPPAAPQDQLTAATGGTKEVVDASLTPVRREYMARLAAGHSGAELVKYLRSVGVTDPALYKTAGEQAAFRRKNPNVPIEQYNTSAIDHITQQMSAVNQGLNAAGQTAVGTGVAAAGNAVAGNYLPEIVGATGGNSEQARAALDYSAQDHPNAALMGGIVGGATAALGGEAALARGAGMAPGVARSLAADSAYGAIAGSGASPDNRAEGAAIGAGAGAVGSVAGQYGAKAASGALRGIVSSDASKLMASGVDNLTIGQSVGGKVKAIEDKLTSYVPGITSRRAEGIRTFNAKAFDKALEPIGQKVGGKTGEEAAQHAHDAVSQAFTNALSGKVAQPDQPFVAQSRTALGRLATIKRNDLGQEIVGQIEEATKDLFDPNTGALTGENMQTFLESMRQLRQAYKNDPLSARVIAPAIKQIEKATESMFERQAPEVMPAYNAAKAAYRRVSVLDDAVNRAKNSGEKLFTTGQLGQADRANAIKYDGKARAAQGSGVFHDYHSSAQGVLPSNIPDSGTAGRLAMAAIPAAAIGGGAGYEVGGHNGARAGLGIVGVLSLLYSKGGQRALVAAATKRDGLDRVIANALEKYQAAARAAGASGGTIAASRAGYLPAEIPGQ